MLQSIDYNAVATISIKYLSHKEIVAIKKIDLSKFDRSAKTCRQTLFLMVILDFASDAALHMVSKCPSNH